MDSISVIGLDIGNTSIKSTIFNDDGITEIVHHETIEEVRLSYGNAAYWVCATGLDREVVESQVNVRGWVDHTTRMPIRLDYETPATLGADRITAAVGVRKLLEAENILLIDFGTCNTYDVVKGEAFMGGVISPGMTIRYGAMNHYTNALPDLREEEASYPKMGVGKTTRTCMHLGVQRGIRFEIEGFIEHFSAIYGELEVVITGGSAPDFDYIRKAHIFASSKIVLEGLHSIWKYNEGS